MTSLFSSHKSDFFKVFLRVKTIMCVCVYDMCQCCAVEAEEGIRSLELELQEVELLHVGDGTQTRVL